MLAENIMSQALAYEKHKHVIIACLLVSLQLFRRAGDILES